MKQQMHGHLFPSLKQRKKDEHDIRDTTEKNKNEFVSDIFQWIPSDGRANDGRSTRTCLQQLKANPWLENLSKAIDNRDKLRVKESVKSALAAQL